MLLNLGNVKSQTSEVQSLELQKITTRSGLVQIVPGLTIERGKASLETLQIQIFVEFQVLETHGA